MGQDSGLSAKILGVLRDPLFLGNLVLRLALWAWAVYHGSFILADSQYYLHGAEQVCHGDWGGDSYRMPFYFWFLCAFSFGGTGLALLVQTLAVWGAGVAMRARVPRVMTALWLFDPVLLVYSGLAMTDALFGVAVYGLACSLQAVGEARTHSVRAVIVAGIWMALAILIRPVGLPILILTLLYFGALYLKRQASVAGIALYLGVVAILLFPRLYWNGTHNQIWKLTSQGANITAAMAGIVEYSGQGLDFTQAEIRWHTEHPGAAAQDAYATILSHPAEFIALTTRGVARVIFGHVNAEWVYWATGSFPIGPGWFKPRDQGAGERLDFSGLGARMVWILGIAVTLAYVVFEYWSTAKVVLGRRVEWNLFTLFCAVTAAVLAVAPLVVGDARFRIPVIAALWAMAGVLNRPRSG